MNNYRVMDWNEFEERVKSQLHIHFLSLDTLLELPETKKLILKWHHLDGWEDLDDIEIYTYIENLKKPAGKLLLITEASYKNHLGAFELDASAIRYSKPS
jgi:hypothetical protein